MSDSRYPLRQDCPSYITLHHHNVKNKESPSSLKVERRHLEVMLFSAQLSQRTWKCGTHTSHNGHLGHQHDPPHLHLHDLHFKQVGSNSLCTATFLQIPSWKYFISNTTTKNIQSHLALLDPSRGHHDHKQGASSPAWPPPLPSPSTSLVHLALPDPGRGHHHLHADGTLQLLPRMVHHHRHFPCFQEEVG